MFKCKAGPANKMDGRRGGGAKEETKEGESEEKELRRKASRRLCFIQRLFVLNMHGAQPKSLIHIVRAPSSFAEN